MKKKKARYGQKEKRVAGVKFEPLNSLFSYYEKATKKEPAYLPIEPLSQTRDILP